MVTTLTLNGRHLAIDDIRHGRYTANTPFEESTLSFSRQWLNGQSQFSLKTSGSTGEPKEMQFTREQLQLSARQTINYFKLSPADTVLVCLNTAYIAGLMMLVRAFESGTSIIAVEPTEAYLDKTEQQFTFVALVPLQLERNLTNPAAKIKLEECRAIIVGGAPVTPSLENLIAESTANIYATFGMTETLTHFALKRLNPHKEDFYTAFEGVELSNNDRGCLIVTSPVTLNLPQVTSDVVEIVSSHQFKWLGRIDNTINSGGIKMQLEQIEEKIAQVLAMMNRENRFFAAAMDDATLGQKLVLYIEGDPENDLLSSSVWEEYMHRYEVPKAVKYCTQFVNTPTGKINRPKTIEKALKS